MPAHFLDRFFNPQSIAIFGASERDNAVGTRVFRNVLEAGFKGDIYPINPKHTSLLEHTCYADLKQVHGNIDLAVIATPAHTVPDIIHQCGQHHIRAAVVISAGFAETGEDGKRLQRKMLDAAQDARVRIVGPNCLGLIRPDIGLNATFSKNAAAPGKLALVSQSGALCTAILDWALDHDIGFSAIASLGNTADVDFGDMLDFLSTDQQTRAILVYVEGVNHARPFISGLRAAARLKPVVVIKSGRHAEGSRAAVSHTGALIGADDVFDAALSRAGVVRADSLKRLFSAAELLASGLRADGNRLAIVSNGGGPGVLATDRAVETGLELAQLSDDTLKALQTQLPEQWSHGNPVDVLGDADTQRYQTALQACLDDPGVDGAVVLLTPQAMTEPLDIAKAVSTIAKTSRKPVLTCWMGSHQVGTAREHFEAAAIPTFETPEAAVEAFAYLAQHRRNQSLLLEVPETRSLDYTPDVDGARMIIESALADGRRVLSTTESKAVLRAFQIEVSPAIEARSAQDALVAAETLGFPVAMKVSASKVTHKTDIGGVHLDVGSAADVRRVFHDITAAAKAVLGEGADIRVTVERMVSHQDARELMLGVVRDPAFGPVISFGAGGTMVEIMRDRAISLPPLNALIAADLIDRTRIARLLKRFRHMPAVNRYALIDILMRLSDMVCELPEIVEMDINPLMASPQGAVAVDARIVVEHTSPTQERYGHTAIVPYPAHLVEHVVLDDGTQYTIRPIRPEDASIEQIFVKNLSKETKYFRFMENINELTPAMLVRFTQIDYDREMAFIAVTGHGEHAEEIGVARYVINPDGESCEFAIVISDHWQGKGLGRRLMHALMSSARNKRISRMEGDVLANNSKMLGMMERLGFRTWTDPEDRTVKKVEKTL